MVCRKGVLVVGEDFFVEFFSRAEAAVFDLDVFVRGVACELDHSSCEVVDLDGLAHVEDEDLVACGHCSGFHHKAAGLRDGHEKAGDLRMSHCHRASLGDLLAEARDHRAIRAEDVAEAGCDELCAAVHLALLESESERLDIDFSQTLGATHDVGRVDCLVC